MRTVYFDHAATSPVDPRVLDTMLPFLRDDYGNAASIHQMGRKANVAVEAWRGKIARLIGAQASEIIFTSGGTESNNTAIFGALQHTNRHHIVTAKSEHSAVLYPLRHAEKAGCQVNYVKLDSLGRVTPSALEHAITDETDLVTIMHANNETGTINPLPDLVRLCKTKNILFHTDAVQSIAKIPLHVDTLGIDFLSISGHKFHGPKGIGALYVREGTPWSTWLHGGTQERGRRGGTLNVAGIVGLGKALELAYEEMDQNISYISTLKRRFKEGLKEKFGDTIQFNGDVDHGMHNILSVTITDTEHRPLDGEMLLLNLDIEGICCSNGSACTSGTVKPSHVMLALGHSEEMAKSTLRFSLAKTNSIEEIDKTIEALHTIVSRHTVTSV
ncbi:MAG: cysteine desulfurase family protein [Balneolales bacterium]